MHVHLRQASLEDAVLLARLNYSVHSLHVQHVPQRYKRTTPDDAWIIATFQRQLTDGDYIYIGEVDGTPAGYVHCKIQRVEENAFIHAYTALHIDQMGVEEAYRRQGVGHVLMEQVFALARSLDIETVSLGVNQFNEDAQQFYRKHGFEVISMRMAAQV